MEESRGTHYRDTEAQESGKPTTEAQRHGEKQMPAEDQNIKTLPLITLIALIFKAGKAEELTTGTRRKQKPEEPSTEARRHGAKQMPAEDQNIKTLPLMTLIALIVTDGKL